MTTIYDRINAGEFNNTIPFASRKENREQYDRWLAERARLDAAFRTACEEEEGVEFMSKEALDAMWNKAWEDGHASGYSEVWGCYQDVAELALVIWKDGAESTGNKRRATDGECQAISEHHESHDKAMATFETIYCQGTK